MAELWLDRADAMPRPCRVWVKLGPRGPEMRLPLCTRKPTSSARQAMSEKCHKQTHCQGPI